MRNVAFKSAKLAESVFACQSGAALTLTTRRGRSIYMMKNPVHQTCIICVHMHSIYDNNEECNIVTSNSNVDACCR